MTYSSVRCLCVVYLGGLDDWLMQQHIRNDRAIVGSIVRALNEKMRNVVNFYILFVICFFPFLPTTLFV